MLIIVKYSYNFILQKKNIDFFLSQLTSDGCTSVQHSVQYSVHCTIFSNKSTDPALFTARAWNPSKVLRRQMSSVWARE